MLIFYYETILHAVYFESATRCNMQCVKQHIQLFMQRETIKNYYDMKKYDIIKVVITRSDFIWFVLAIHAFNLHKFSRTSHGDSTSQILQSIDLAKKKGKRDCLRFEELLSNCPARPFLTKPPIKHYRGYQEAVDHFHGFALALIQHALILRSYILARYMLMCRIITT